MQGFPVPPLLLELLQQSQDVQAGDCCGMAPAGCWLLGNLQRWSSAGFEAAAGCFCPACILYSMHWEVLLAALLCTGSWVALCSQALLSKDLGFLRLRLLIPLL